MAIELRKCSKLSWAWCDGYCDRCNTYSTSFTINPPSSSIKHGHWIYKEYGYPLAHAFYKCSECGYKHELVIDNYCPNCGAKMDDEYKGCQNCKYQIEPLRGCEWLERGGDGVVHLICPMWERR